MSSTQTYQPLILRSASIDGEIRSAQFSKCEKYRYCLDIIWDALSPRLTVIGLNPSTATELEDDPTLRRVKAFARSYGCGSVRMLNAFAWRSTSPLELFKVADPVGPGNTLEWLFYNSTPRTVAAWGITIQKKKWAHWYRGHDIAAAIPNLHCFRKTPSGHPEHPLYLPGDLRAVPFSYEVAA